MFADQDNQEKLFPRYTYTKNGFREKIHQGRINSLALEKEEIDNFAKRSASVALGRSGNETNRSMRHWTGHMA